MSRRGRSAANESVTIYAQAAGVCYAREANARSDSRSEPIEASTAVGS